MNLFNIKDQSLLSRLKNDNKEAFVEAYDLYVDQIYRFVFFKVGNKEEAEDITSAVFLKTWNYIQETEKLVEKTLKALLYKIARTTIIDHYRKKSSQANLSIDDVENGFDAIDESQNVEENFQIQNDIELVQLKLQELKDEYREIILMRYINEMSIDEIAELLGKSKGNVRVLTHRALKALSDIMSEEK
ncbi:MAG: RNA polymerase sigma factor [Patescibacteria group bacterium]|jgi:RNA polymerase sigma-70 factor (ECF subfamily)|nr:RNA polymerase sigma factor [Patescibacteria group bacterium]